METTLFKTFNYLENGEVNFSVLNTIKTTTKILPGFYNLNGFYENGNIKVSLTVQNIKENFPLHNFPDRERIEHMLESFFNKEVQFSLEKLNILNKIGILLYGKEGTGKSSIFKYYANKFIKEKECIVFNLTDRGDYIKTCWKFIASIREIQSNPIILIIDEMDGILNYNSSNESSFKSILDGYLSINNIIFFASTNYIDKIPESLKNRESRFKYSLNIEGIQEKNFILEILTLLLKEYIEEKDIHKYSDELKGKTLDEIKQFCIDIIMNLKHYKKVTKKIGFKN